MKSSLLFFIILLLTACNSEKSSESTQHFKNLTSDSLLLNSFVSETKALNIPQIVNGVDSFELRIWHGITIAVPKHLVILKYQDSSWSLTRIDYWFNYQWQNGHPDKVFLDSSSTQTVNPFSDISELVESINQFRLDTFPSQHEIPGFRDRVADGMFYNFEIATPHFYKALSYNNPDRYSDPYNRQISQLITILGKIGVYSMP